MNNKLLYTESNMRQWVAAKWVFAQVKRKEKKNEAQINRRVFSAWGYTLYFHWVYLLSIVKYESLAEVLITLQANDDVAQLISEFSFLRIIIYILRLGCPPTKSISRANTRIYAHSVAQKEHQLHSIIDSQHEIICVSSLAIVEPAVATRDRERVTAKSYFPPRA